MLQNLPIMLFGISPFSVYYACFYAFQKCFMLLFCVFFLCTEKIFNVNGVVSLQLQHTK